MLLAFPNEINLVKRGVHPRGNEWKASCSEFYVYFCIASSPGSDLYCILSSLNRLLQCKISIYAHKFNTSFYLQKKVQRLLILVAFPGIALAQAFSKSLCLQNRWFPPEEISSKCPQTPRWGWGKWTRKSWAGVRPGRPVLFARDIITIPVSEGSGLLVLVYTLPFLKEAKEQKELVYVLEMTRWDKFIFISIPVFL